MKNKRHEKSAQAKRAGHFYGKQINRANSPLKGRLNDEEEGV